MHFFQGYGASLRQVDLSADTAGDMHRRERAIGQLRALAAPIRLEILEAVGAAELTAGQIVERVGGNQPNVSQHLKVLLAVGLLCCRRDGRHIWYRQRCGSASELYDMLGHCLVSGDAGPGSAGAAPPPRGLSISSFDRS